jgi:DNA topoisomerase-3
VAVAVIAEKPSVARDVARVLGARTRGEGVLAGNGYVVTWAIGHLVALAQPHEIRPEWKRWTLEGLPMIPDRWPLVVLPDRKEQFEVVAGVLSDRSVERVVCATDAGREGELIFRYLYERAGCRKPVERLWLSALTPDAIRAGFARLRPGADLDALADAARGRSRADWLVGMNLSRAATLAHGETLHVGRVQTPTLAMLAERERAIRAFVPEDYLEVVAAFGVPRAEAGRYRGTWFRPPSPTAEAKRLPPDGAEAQAIVARAEAGRAEVESAAAETRRIPPPLLYDLTELQRHANRLYGLSAKQTLAAAQSLYERKKLLSYPRTDSRHLSAEVAATLPAVAGAISGSFAGLLAPGTGERPLSRRFVDDSRVTDHHAILPTALASEGLSLSADERRIYDLVCRRLLMAWHAEHVFSVTTVITRVSDPDAAAPEDRFHSTGTAVESMGWKVLEPSGRRSAAAARPRRAKDGADAGGEAAEQDQELPPGLAAGLAVEVLEAKPVAKRTRPPRRFTDATLLTAMETAGRRLDDRELAEAMKETGLGTPATRAEIIETLVRRGYAERQGRALSATERGLRLVDRVHPDVKSPALTAGWEARLSRIQRGQADLPGFMREIEAHVRDLVAATLGGGPPGAGERAARRPGAAPGPVVSSETAALPAPPATSPSAPAATGARRSAAAGTGSLSDLLRTAFRLEAFRPRQEAVCRAVAEGHDVLLVMPTGAGKSLCYQLPGLARGGSALVVSPLIALMEDQVAKLRALGLQAERIHSARDRARCRQALSAYLEGRLDFLFVAPERLGVPGFCEALARRPPALVAVDEAHCISEWGHDFRPDYRRLGARLHLLRPAPVIALTATATPRVQDDIAAQLGLRPRRFIHGFRRENIAVEVARLPPSRRAETAGRILSDPARRPAIVYAPTRREADALGASLSRAFPAAAYHAGMTAALREQVQDGFLAGRVEAVAATIAFGMGVDKPDVRTVIHTALPGTLEGFSQEIGRAGRDGQPSRAVLLHSWSDRRTHDFFHERSYPEPEVLGRVFRALGSEPRPAGDLARRLRMDPEALDAALEKLWIHGGAHFSTPGGEQRVSRGDEGWLEPYRRQRAHRREQLDRMQRFADGHACRMAALARHFGDQDDRGEPCGRCDVCDPGACLVRSAREPEPAEREAVRVVIEALRRRDGQATGRLHSECGAARLERRGFEDVLGGMVRAGLLRLAGDTFDTEGRTVSFQRAWLTDASRTGSPAAMCFSVPEEKGRAAAPARCRGRAGQRTRARPAAAAVAADPDLVAGLRKWRTNEAKRARVPAFRILHDRTLAAVAAAAPRDEASLLAVPGMGPALLRRFGGAILGLCRAARSGTAPARRRSGPAPGRRGRKPVKEA